MSATFLELHKVEKRIIKALDALDEQDRWKVLGAVLALYGPKPEVHA